MFLFRKSDQPKATKANLGEQSSMYYDEEKKKWRERGKEHLEPEEKELAPPPMSKPKDEKEGNGDAPVPPKPELTGVDALIAPPNPYMNRLGNKGVVKPPVVPPAANPEAVGADGEQPGAPPSNPFGAPVPATGVNPFGPRSLAATQPFNPNAPRNVASSPNPNDPSDAPAVGGATAASPFGQRSMAATQPFNPNAPRSVGGGPGPNPNAPRARNRPQAKPRPTARSPFGAPAAGAPPTGVPPPEFGGGDPEGGDDEPVGRSERLQEVPARRAPPPTLVEEEETDNSATPSAIPPSPFSASMPAYSPLAAPARTAVAPGSGLPPLRTRAGPFAANGPGAEGGLPAAPPQDAEGAGQEMAGLGETGVAAVEPPVLEPPLAEPLQIAEPPEEQRPAPVEAAVADPDAAAAEPEVALPAETTVEAEVAFAEADAPKPAETHVQAPAEMPEQLAGPPVSVEPPAMESSVWGEDLGDLLSGVETDAATPAPVAMPEDPVELVPPVVEATPEAQQSVEQAPQDAGWDIELEGFDDKPSAANTSEVTTTAAEAEQLVKEAGARDLTLSNGESTSSWVLLTGEAQAEASAATVAAALSGAAPEGPAASESPAQKAEEAADEPLPTPVADVVAKPLIADGEAEVAAEALAAVEEAVKKEQVDALFAPAPEAKPAAYLIEEVVEAAAPPAVASGPDLFDMAAEEPVPQNVELGALDSTAVPPAAPGSLDLFSTVAPAPAPELAKGSDLAEVFSMDAAEAPAPAMVPDSVDSLFSEPATARLPTAAEQTMPEVQAPLPAAEPVPQAAALFGTTEPAPQVAALFEAAEPAPQAAALFEASEPAPRELEVPLLAAAEAAPEDVPLLETAEPAPRDVQAPLFPAAEASPEEAPPVVAAEPTPRELQAAAGSAPQEPEPAPVPAAQEAELAGLRARTAELERQLGELRRQAAAREEELRAAQCQERAQRERAEAALAEAKGQLEGECSQAIAPARAEGDEEFNLPDFVWSCGNSEVMAFVQKIVGENASLRRQVSLAPATALAPTPALPAVASPPFVAHGASAESAAAFAGTVAAEDGHQIPSLLALLEEHASDLKVCSQVCTALETLTFTLPEQRQAVASVGGVKAILDVLDRHQDAEPALLRPCMDALWNLTFEDEAVDSTSEARGVERLATLMKKHGSDPELLGPACAVLLNLAVREQNRWKIVDCGCVALVANAMQQHAQNEEVLELGCQALYMLAYHQDLKPLVLAAKGGDAAALAASCPRSAGRAQKWGRWLQEVLAC